jgi:hypothetical protein
METQIQRIWASIHVSGHERRTHPTDGDHQMILGHVYDKPFMVRLPHRSEWKGGFHPDRKGGLIWYTDGSKTKKGTGAGVYGYGTRQKLHFTLEKYITVFQAEVYEYATKPSTVENFDRGYTNRNIYILSDHSSCD